MSTQNFLEELKALKPIELLGKEFLRVYGHEMDHTHLIYLDRNPLLKDPVKALGSPAAIRKMAAIAAQIIADNRNSLSEHNFLPADKDIEFEQLMRYIHIPRHRHDFVELVFVLSGKCRHLLDGHEVIHVAGDFSIVPPDLPHELFADDECVCLTVKIRKNNFRQNFFGIMTGNSLLSSYFTQVSANPYYHFALTLHSGEDPFFRYLVLQMYAQLLDAKVYHEIIIESLLAAVFVYLLQNYQDSAEFLTSDSVNRTRIIMILNFIFENYQYITLRETARHFYLSVPYLSTMLHRETGQTFTQLLKDYKLQQAARMLRSDHKKLDLICEAIGYHNTAQFIRSFKEKFGVTPGQYRKSYHQKTTE